MAKLILPKMSAARRRNMPSPRSFRIISAIAGGMEEKETTKIIPRKSFIILFETDPPYSKKLEI